MTLHSEPSSSTLHIYYIHVVNSKRHAALTLFCHPLICSCSLFLVSRRDATFSSANNTFRQCHVFYSTPTFYPDAKLSSHLCSAFISFFLFSFFFFLFNALFTTFKIRNDVSNSHTLWNGFHNTRCIIILILNHRKAFCFNFLFNLKEKTHMFSKYNGDKSRYHIHPFEWNA